MSNVKLLNLDELAANKRAVVINGVEYEVAEQTVGEMIKRLQVTKKVDTETPEGFLEVMRDTAQTILPKAPKKVIDNLTIKQITALIEFINDRELDEAANEVRNADQGEKREQVDNSGKKS